MKLNFDFNQEYCYRFVLDDGTTIYAKVISSDDTHIHVKTRKHDYIIRWTDVKRCNLTGYLYESNTEEIK